MRFIVVVSPSYGGAERRFFDVYTGLRRRSKDIFYVGPSLLLDELKKDHPERQDVFDGLIAVPLDRWSAARFVWKYARLLRSLPPGSAFHYPMNCLWPLHIGRRDRLSVSFVDCKSVPRLFSRSRTTTLSYIAFSFVSKIDVLNPEIFKSARRSRAGKRMTLTPGGTFLLPAVDVATAKEPVVVWLGRLLPDKGILDFLRITPELWASLKGRVPAAFRLLIAGYGPLEPEVVQAVEELAAQNIPISFVGYARAHAIMNGAAVVLSVQQNTNYPSRVVAEALCAGCAVIVRDSGDSRLFGELPGLVYCRDPLDAGELAGAIAKLTTTLPGDPAFCNRIRAAASARFSTQEYLRYFDELISASTRPRAGAAKEDEVIG